MKISAVSAFEKSGLSIISDEVNGVNGKETFLSLRQLSQRPDSSGSFLAIRSWDGDDLPPTLTDAIHSLPKRSVTGFDRY